jgi:hypothetical protein
LGKETRNKHGFATNMGTALAVDGFAIEIIKHNASALNGQEVTANRNRKGLWGLISQVGCDSNTKVHFFQTDWPRAKNDLTCFRSTMLHYQISCTLLEMRLIHH